MVLLVAGALVVGVVLTGLATVRPGPARQPTLAQVRSWVYQLQGYPEGRLDDIERAPHDLAVVDLARDARADWFTAEEVGRVQDSGKLVLAYVEIGAIEDFRPEAGAVRRSPEGLVLNRWEDWPEEHFVRYWEQSWWELVLRPRLDRALEAGFDGVYLDTPLAYEELDRSLVPGISRAELARRMVALIGRICDYGRAADPGFLVVPQNSPELAQVPGYLDAVDGIGMEELFFLATDEPCTRDWCQENLEGARALREAGKVVLAVDYASEPALVAQACRRYAEEGFVGYVAPVALDRVAPPCS